ncbi:UNKNOWN [Stylonychia lemnae]|uniref:Uncharacterized protein n=1 Tax=Stylonychia lemnae TaxID=5949 RepID=A0A078ATD7_STYLE|nr:UNKNOWN [Stylonychia lemnae]|eukprot:CDW85474.1 UNKNOWN [Stylonychia lemnae]
MNHSISHIFEDKYQKSKKFNLDDIPTKENSYKTSPLKEYDLGLDQGSKLLNFKEFYQNSKLNLPSTKSSKSTGMVFTRSKSSFDKDRGSLLGVGTKNRLKEKLLDIKPLINYNINEYLPRDNLKNSRHSLNTSNLLANSIINVNSINHSIPINNNLIQSQITTKNVFQSNGLQQQVNLSPNPIFQSHQQQNQPCMQCQCGSGSGILSNVSSANQFQRQFSQQQMMQTQRSNCSCQYSQSSACHSSYASPISSQSKNHFHHNHTNSRQNFNQINNQNINLQNLNPMSQLPQTIKNNYLGNQNNGFQGANTQLQFLKQNLNMTSSNENTPFKNNLNILNQQQQNYNQHQIMLNQIPSLNINKSPGQNKENSFAMQNKSSHNISASFLKTNEKTSQNVGGGGYNTDDLLRDSESEVEVGNNIQDAHQNFLQGFQNYLKISQPQNADQDRAQKELLAMQIIQGNLNFTPQQQIFQNLTGRGQNTNFSSNLNESQLKTVKQSQINPGGLTLDALQISNINQTSPMRTPQSQFDINLASQFETNINLYHNQEASNQNNQHAKFNNNLSNNNNVLHSLNPQRHPQQFNQMNQMQQQQYNLNNQQQQFQQQVHQQNQLLPVNHLQILQQQYQSPCFNSFEDSSLNMFGSNPQANKSQQTQIQGQQLVKQNSLSQKTVNEQLTGQNKLFNYQLQSQNEAQNYELNQQQMQDNFNLINQSYQTNQNDNFEQIQLTNAINMNYLSVQQQQQQQNNQVKYKQQKNKDKPKRKKSLNKKLLKKTYDEEDYSHRKQQSSLISEDESFDESDRGESSAVSVNNSLKYASLMDGNQRSNMNIIEQQKSDHKNDQSLIRVLKEMNIQAQDIDMNQQMQMNSYLQQDGDSFMDKSDLQVQSEKQKQDASCQYEPLSQNPNQQNQRKQQLLPPQQKRAASQNKFQQPQVIPIKSVGCSMPSSKNSTMNNNGTHHHFQSHNPSQDLEDYQFHIDDESIQHQQLSIGGGNSCGTTSNGKINILTQQNINQANHFSQPSILSPYTPNANHYNNFDHFKSHCSEVIIRGSSETDISNKIAAMKLMKGNNDSTSQHFQSQNMNQQNTSHQISGSQSIVNIGPHTRSQFTSIETHNQSPTKNTKKRIQELFENNVSKIIHSRNDLQTESSYEANDRFNENMQLLAGDTFMKNQKMIMEGKDSHQRYKMEPNRYQTKQDVEIYHVDEYKTLETQENQKYDEYQTQQTTEAAQLPEDNFNSTIRLNDIPTMNSAQKSPAINVQRPPMYQNHNPIHFNPTFQQNTSSSYQNPYLNNTGSTAGFPQVQGYQFSQQTGRKSNCNSSFHSQNIKTSNSQTSLSITNRSQYHNQSHTESKSQQIKKKNVIDQIIFLQRHIKQFLAKRRQSCENEINAFQQEQENHLGGFFGDSTIQKPVEESLSNISAQLLNSLKQSLGGSNVVRHHKPNDQSYQKNILESLNLTTGNTFIKETRQFGQGQLKDRTQFLGNSSALVLYSGSTHDNRQNPFLNAGMMNMRISDQNFLGNNNIDSQQSYGKPPLYEYEQAQRDQNMMQQMSPQNTSLLNMTEESNSGIFKLTPLASQNVTQKTGQIQAYNQTSQMNERTTESNNLNYSCSEMDSEWCNNFQKDNAISPMSINTTSSKIRNLNGTKSGQRIPVSVHNNHINNIQNNIMFQRSGSVQSEQIQGVNGACFNNQKSTQKIKIEDNIQSPLSISQIPSTRSAANIIPTKHEKMLNMLKSEDYGAGDQIVVQIQDSKAGLMNPQVLKSNTKLQNCQLLQQRELRPQSMSLDSTDNNMSSAQSTGVSYDWRLLKPTRESDLCNLLSTLLNQTNQQPQPISSYA